MYLIVLAPTEVIFKQTFGIFWISADAYGIMSTDIIRAEVRIGCHTISQSDYGIMSTDIIRAEVRIGCHAISQGEYGIMPPAGNRTRRRCRLWQLNNIRKA